MSEQNKFMFGVLLILSAMFFVIVWYNKNKVEVGGLDCNTNTCTDKKGNVIPISKCNEIGLTC